MTDILWFDELGMGDVAQVGGKNASLGEMVSKLGDLGVRVPGGFATTADAYHRFLEGDGLYDRIMQLVLPLDVADVTELARVAGLDPATGDYRLASLTTPQPGDLP